LNVTDLATIPTLNRGRFWLPGTGMTCSWLPNLTVDYWCLSICLWRVSGSNICLQVNLPAANGIYD